MSPYSFLASSLNFFFFSRSISKHFEIFNCTLAAFPTSKTGKVIGLMMNAEKNPDSFPVVPNPGVVAETLRHSETGEKRFLNGGEPETNGRSRLLLLRSLSTLGPT